MKRTDAWLAETFDDADDAAAAELGRLLLAQRARLVFNGSVTERLNAETASAGEAPIPSALWDVCDAESVTQTHLLYRDAGANVALTNTFDCGPGALRMLDVRSSCEDVCAAAVRSAFLCAPRFVMGLVGAAANVPTAQLEDEAEEMAAVLIARGVHGIFVRGSESSDRTLALVRGVQKSNDAAVVPRPVLLSVAADDTGVRSSAASLLDAVSSPCLVGFGFSGVDPAQARGLGDAVGEVAARGLVPYLGFRMRDYREIELANAAGWAVSHGVEVLCCESGAPIAATAVLAEALGI